MTSDVVLTAALRNNLLSLQRTQGLIDKTQLRLATGLKVNSALDNPQNFFASQALKNRASDLNRLLDGIGYSLRSGYRTDSDVNGLKGVAAGGGLTFGRVSFDFAWVPFGELGNTYRYAIHIKFGSDSSDDKPVDMHMQKASLPFAEPPLTF